MPDASVVPKPIINEIVEENDEMWGIVEEGEADQAFAPEMT